MKKSILIACVVALTASCAGDSNKATGTKTETDSTAKA